MRLSILRMLAPIIAFASGRIIDLSVPTSVKPDDTIIVNLSSVNYTVSVTDIAVTFSWSSLPHYREELEELDTFLIGKEYSNLGNEATIAVQTKVPKRFEGLPLGHKVEFGATIYSLYGDERWPVLEILSVNVTIGNNSSAAY
ncbi:uncharacterized protein BDR25DRAFT_196280, partial [Lindgomyces ingoldianus]